jgi:hypothetical protein
MYYVNVKESQHEFDKKNLVTISGRKGGYDNKICKYCGIKGKQYALEIIQIGENYKEENAFLCPKAPKKKKPKQIKITICRAVGRVFENLTPNSIHNVVDVPKGEKEDNQGFWVMGKGEPVKVLNNEFTVVVQAVP